jgi:hypothetical protein
MPTELGKLLQSPQPRDAIHIATACVTAAVDLRAGQHIGFIGEDQYVLVGPTGKHIGIVDPFLDTFVPEGSKFWMLLYPNTITALRHEWIHPAFGEEVVIEDGSKAYIREFAAKTDQTYNRIMRAADYWVLHGEYTRDDTETYYNLTSEDWAEFWKHYELVTNQKVKDKSSFFTCSC